MEEREAESETGGGGWPREEETQEERGCEREMSQQVENKFRDGTGFLTERTPRCEVLLRFRLFERMESVQTSEMQEVWSLLRPMCDYCNVCMMLLWRLTEHNYYGFLQ